MRNPFKKSLRKKAIFWNELPMKTIIYFPADWKIENGLVPLNQNGVFFAKKKTKQDVYLGLTVEVNVSENPYSPETVKNLTNDEYLKNEPSFEGPCLYSERIEIDKAEGAWTLQKKKFAGHLFYRANYFLYYWKYKFHISYSVSSVKEEDALKMYKKMDGYFYEWVTKTKLKWIKG